MSTVVSVNLVEGLFSNDFKYFIDNWSECVAQVNPLIVQVTSLEPVNGVPVSYTVAKCPPPLSNRLSFNARYVRYDREPGEILFMMSERGAESRVHTVDKNLVLARCFVAGWQFIPVLDSAGEVVGT